MKKRRVQTLLAQVLRRIAPEIGAVIVMEPDWGVVGQITFQTGRRRYFRYSSLDLNPLGASGIAKDKDFAAFFMRRMGYPAVPGKSFFSSDWANRIGSRRDIHSAYKYALKIGFPVIVKPNSGSQGSDVALVHNKRDFYGGLRAIFKTDRVALIQKPIVGNDYRIVVLDERVISAYQRIPLNVVGDGKTTIRRLLDKKQRTFAKFDRDTQIRIDDPRIMKKLSRQRINLDSVPEADSRVFLLDNANLSTGGDSVDVTEIMNLQIKEMAVRLTKDMGLRFCGVDLMVDGPIEKETSSYWILEINAAPGLDHYARSGREQQKIVEELYLEVLKSMER